YPSMLRRRPLPSPPPVSTKSVMNSGRRRSAIWRRSSIVTASAAFIEVRGIGGSYSLRRDQGLRLVPEDKSALRNLDDIVQADAHHRDDDEGRKQHVHALRAAGTLDHVAEPTIAGDELTDDRANHRKGDGQL